MCFRPSAVDMKRTCPKCNEDCSMSDVVCNHCGENLPKGPGMPGAPGAPSMPSAPGSPKAPGTPL